MIQATLRAADYRAQTEAGMQDARGVCCTFTMDGNPAQIQVQVDSAGCVTLVYKADKDADPKSILVSFVDELAICDQCAMTDIEGVMTAE